MDDVVGGGIAYKFDLVDYVNWQAMSSVRITAAGLGLFDGPQVTLLFDSPLPGGIYFEGDKRKK